LRGGQGGVEVRLREFLDAESEQEVVLSEDIDGVLADILPTADLPLPAGPVTSTTCAASSASSTFCTSAARGR
jgi:hypothetical protein